MSTVPTKINISTPLPSAPPKGKTVLFLQCEEAQCGYEGQGMAAAAKAIGWNLKILNFQAANPATLVTALQEGLQYHPVAAVFSGVPEEAWQSEAKAYAAAGAVIIDNYVSEVTPGPGVLLGRGYSAQYVQQGELLADEVVTNSGGAPAKSLMVTIPSYPVFGPMVTGYKDQMAKLCPSCQVTELDATIPQLMGNELIPAVVSAAKRTSGLQYIVTVDGEFLDSLPQALQAAGLAGKFKIISGNGAATDQQDVLNGTWLATASSPFIVGGFQDMDEAIRTVMHLPIPAGDHQEPYFIMTKSNIGTPENSYDKPDNYAQQYEQLWHVG